MSDRCSYPVLRIALSLITGCVLGGCDKAVFDTPEELQSYIRNVDGPFSQQIEREGVVFTLRYVPPAAFHTSDLAGGDFQASSAASRSREEEKLGQMLHFVLTIEPEEGDLVFARMRASRTTYSAWLEQLLFNMDKAISLHVPGAAPVPLSTYHMERTYGTQPGRSFMLVFPSRWQKHDLRSIRGLELRVAEFGLRTGSISFDLPHPFPTATLRPTV